MFLGAYTAALTRDTPFLRELCKKKNFFPADTKKC